MFSDNYISKFQIKIEYSSKIIEKIHNVCHKIQQTLLSVICQNYQFINIHVYLNTN